MILRLTLTLCLGVCSLGSCMGQQDLADKIESLANPYVESKTVVGLSIGVIKEGKTAEVHLGTKDRRHAPNGDTVYEIGSLSKVFTGTLLGDAVARSELKLDQAAQDLLPEGVKMPSGKTRAITLKDMSIHRSGLPRLPDNMPSLTTDNPYADYTSELAHKFLSAHELQRQPGQGQEYSNFAVSVLGNLLCRNAGKDYDTLLAERITGPLKMTNTSVKLTPAMKTQLAKPFGDVDTPSANWDFADMPGAGGIRSSTKDLLKFAQACLKAPDNPTGNAIELAWKEHDAGGRGQAKMGLGWNIAADVGGTRWHAGQTGGYHSMLMVNRKLNLAVVVLTNTSNSEVDQLSQEIIRALTGADVQPRQFAKEVTVDAKKMQRLVGRYQLAPNFVFDIKIDDGKLKVGITNQPTQRVYARSETEWFYKSVKASLKFNVDADGKCDSLILLQNGMRQKAKRIE